MNKLQNPAYLVVCYNESGFCRSIHFNTEYDARAWVEENRANYTKLVVEKNVDGEWRPDRKRFVIVAWPRTGSTHLVQLLNGHGEILCHGEIFQSQLPGIPLRWPDADKDPGAIGDLVNLRSQSPGMFLDRVWSRDYGHECIGFKIFPGHNDEVLEKLTHDSSVRKIVLMRRNVLAAYSSAMIARFTGERLRLLSRSELEWRGAVRFEAEQFLPFSVAYRNFYNNIFERLQEDGQPLHLQLYEQINDSDQIGRLVRFIGAKPVGPLASRLRKQNSADILSRFSNPDDVSRFLETHKLDWGSEPMRTDEI